MNRQHAARTPLSRRAFVQSAGMAGLGLLAACGSWPSRAQQPTNLPRVGFLMLAQPADEGVGIQALAEGLREYGWVEDRNFVIEPRYAGTVAQYPELVAELLALPVDILVSGDTAALLAAKAATNTTPLVMLGTGSATVSGLVASLARPGGNVTGTTTAFPELGGKQLELLRDVVPGATRIAVLAQADHPAASAFWSGLQEPAQVLGLHLQLLEVGSSAELEAAFTGATTASADALFVGRFPTLGRQVQQIVSFAAKSRLPAMYPDRHFVDAGGLFAYGVNNRDLVRRAAYHVDRILRGTRPDELPVERPTTFDFVINLQTARALSLTIPQHVLLQATEIIQ